MFKRIFKWGEDDNGIAGWIMRDMPHFDASYGLGVAHDTLEHFDNGVELEDELQAFGAIVYGRVQGSYWALVGSQYYGDRRPAVQLAHDLSRFLFDNGKPSLRARATRPIDDEDAEEILADVCAETIRTALGEQRYIADSEDERVTEEDMRAAMADALSWMRVGYRRAARRWSFGNREMFAQLFYELEQKVTQVTEQGPEYGEFQDGDELHVSVNRRFDFVVKVKEYRDPYA